MNRKEYFVCFVLLILSSSLLLIAEAHIPRPSLSSSLSSSSRSVSSHSGHKRSLSDPMPSTGNQRLLVVAVEYPSQKGQYTGSAWKNNFFNLWGQFYHDQSYQALQYQIDVVTVNSAGMPVINDATSTSYVPVPNEISAYANGEYGWAFYTQWSLHTVVHDAAVYLDSKGFDWSPYTQNGKVQNFMVMSAGTDYRYAEAVDIDNAASNYLLSTSYSGVQYTTKSGAVLNSYTFCSEHTQDVGSTPLVMAHIGQCAHEFGHALGVPDLYDISIQSTGVGYFDLLGYGIYADGNGDGSTPIGYSAFPKDSLGWISPTIITSEQQVTLSASSLSPNNFLKVYPNASDESFYYYVENRQALDTWDKNFVNQYTTGILIWRVNETAVNDFKLDNHINTYPLASAQISPSFCPSTPAMVLMEADGLQQMSTIGFTLNYGSAFDMWQLGDQFNAPNDLSIAITDLKDEVYTIYISYLGPITIPDKLKSSGNVPATTSLSFTFLVAGFAILLSLLM